MACTLGTEGTSRVVAGRLVGTRGWGALRRFPQEGAVGLFESFWLGSETHLSGVSSSYAWSLDEEGCLFGWGALSVGAEQGGEFVVRPLKALQFHQMSRQHATLNRSLGPTPYG